MYVAKTNSVWHTIQGNIHKLYVNRIETASNWYAYGLDKNEFDRLATLDIISDEELVLMTKLGEKFFNTRENFETQIAGADVTYRIDFPQAMCIPDKWGYYSNRPRIKHPQLVDIAKRRKDAIAQIEAERNAFVEKVKAMFDAAPSINALAKAWPPINDFLPYEVREKMAAKSERTKAKIAESVDLQSMAVDLLRAKIAA